MTAEDLKRDVMVLNGEFWDRIESSNNTEAAKCVVRAAELIRQFDQEEIAGGRIEPSPELLECVDSVAYMHRTWLISVARTTEHGHLVDEMGWEWGPGWWAIERGSDERLFPLGATTITNLGPQSHTPTSWPQ